MSLRLPPSRKRSLAALSASLPSVSPPLCKRTLGALSATLLSTPPLPHLSERRSTQARDDEEPREELVASVVPSSESPACEDRHVLRYSQEAVYCAAFKLHFGIPSDPEPYFTDFCSIQTGTPIGRTRVITNRMKSIRIDLNEVKELQRAVKQLPPSSDTIVQSLKNLLEKSCAISVGLAAVVDHLAFKVPELKNDIAHTSVHMQQRSSLKVPLNTVLSHLNLTQRWTVEESPPFKHMDLKSLMSNWRLPGRARKDDHITQCVDFARFYFIRACNPVDEISKYAVRLSGKHAKDPTKIDLPDDVVETLIKCLLEGLRMGQPELDRMPEELINNPTPFWTELGEADEIRSAKLMEKQAFRDALKGPYTAYRAQVLGYSNVSYIHLRTAKCGDKSHTLFNMLVIEPDLSPKEAVIGSTAKRWYHESVVKAPSSVGHDVVDLSMSRAIRWSSDAADEGAKWLGEETGSREREEKSVKVSSFEETVLALIHDVLRNPRFFFASHRLSCHSTSETADPGVRGTEAGLLLVEHICSLVSGRSVASASVRSISQAWESSRCKIQE
ncbi:unnamed protein product [Nippostrongylus brasiliensis]|uniref:Mitochondrial inner-membrane-bound regulator-domain-containing protein n=1 Tax=Nippostrongylus brasiliensis TaxID=27835 RepID=A0A0N4Y1V0_NIPBR|nr:unnamed protein product [Nippostrongylus brasiliensis]